jgi:hypothetical protein
VRLGFEVAADIPVHRLEDWERISARGELNRATVYPKLAHLPSS